MDHAYGLFAKVPAYFTNGVVDPRSQVRLFAKDSGKLIPQSPGQIIQLGAFIGTVDANPGILDLSPILHISPGLRYELQFVFSKEEIRGVLQLVGHSLFREYSLPSSGEALAFGSGPGNSRSVDLWTSDPSGDDVQVRFIPTLAGAKPSDFARFGSFALSLARLLHRVGIRFNRLCRLRQTSGAKQPRSWRHPECTCLDTVQLSTATTRPSLSHNRDWRRYRCSRETIPSHFGSSARRFSGSLTGRRYALGPRSC